MGTYVFPTRRFKPQSLRAYLEGASLDGGRSIAGESQFADVSGGGRWVIEFGETPLWRPELVKLWRALAAAADDGVTPILVPLADRLHQPVTPAYAGADTFGREIYDDGSVPWTPEEVLAPVIGYAALGQTQIDFLFTAPKALAGGEHFAIEHPTWGWRLYRVIRVVSGGAGTGDLTTVDFRPPLREAVDPGDSPGTLLNFDSPRCLMRADAGFDLGLDQFRFGRAQARFVEFGRPS